MKKERGRGGRGGRREWRWRKRKWWRKKVNGIIRRSERWGGRGE